MAVHSLLSADVTQVRWCELEHTWVQFQKPVESTIACLGYVLVVSCIQYHAIWKEASTNFQPWRQPMIHHTLGCKKAGTIFVADHCITNWRNLSTSSGLSICGPSSLTACCRALTEGWIGTSSQWGLEAMGIWRTYKHRPVALYHRQYGSVRNGWTFYIG